MLYYYNSAGGVRCGDDRFRISRGVRPEVEIVWRAVRPEGPVASRAICGVKSDLPYNRHRVYMLALLHSIWPVIYYDISDRCFQTWWSIFYTIYGEHGGPSGSLSFYYYVYTRFEKIEGIKTGRFQRVQYRKFSNILPIPVKFLKIYLNF